MIALCSRMVVISLGITRDPSDGVG